MTSPVLIILAGPNGAGKTTFATHNLESFIEAGTFLNADEIARTAHPEDVDAVAVQAGRSILSERRQLLSHQLSFCIETTLATLRRFILDAHAEGYISRLIFLFTPHPQLNELRVKQRVMAGGHNIDTDTIRRRHRRGLQLLADYWDICTEGIVFDVRTRRPNEIIRKDTQGTRITSEAAWKLLGHRIQASGGRVLNKG